MSTRKKFKDATNIQWGRVSLLGDESDPSDVIEARCQFAHEAHEPLVDEYGRQWVRVASSGSSFGVQTGFYQTAALGVWGDIKTTPGVLLQVWGTNTDPTVLAFFQLFDATGGPPAPATVPLISIPVQPNNGQFSLSLNQPDYGNPAIPVPFDTNGIEWAVSTAIATYVAAATPFWVNAIYI